MLTAGEKSFNVAGLTAHDERPLIAFLINVGIVAVFAEFLSEGGTGIFDCSVCDFSRIQSALATVVQRFFAILVGKAEHSLTHPKRLDFELSALKNTLNDFRGIWPNGHCFSNEKTGIPFRHLLEVCRQMSRIC